MRNVIIAVGGIIGAVMLTPAAQAVNAPKQTAPGLETIQRVAEGCGYGYHWVGRYRDRNGYWVEGHCARN